MSYFMHLTRSEPSYPIKHMLIQPCKRKPRKDVQREIYFCIFILRHPLDFCFLTHFPAPVLRDTARKLHLVRRGQSEWAAPRYSLVSCPQCLSTSWSNVFMVITPVQAGAERLSTFGGWELRNSGPAPQCWTDDFDSWSPANWPGNLGKLWWRIWTLR